MHSLTMGIPGLLSVPAALLICLAATDADAADTAATGATHQGPTMTSTTTLDNSDLLLNRQRNYVHCSSYRGFARNAVDGNPQSGWTLPDEEKSGWLDASLGLATTFDCIVLREDGDRIRSYSLLAYDGAVWESIARGTTLGTKTFELAPRKASAFRVEIATTGGGGIAALEVHGRELGKAAHHVHQRQPAGDSLPRIDLGSDDGGAASPRHLPLQVGRREHQVVQHGVLQVRARIR